ncbi:pyridoxal 5'-phosphate synthase glutaminase subunit PdxT [Desulfatitalea alkaliphila]|uniref:glutaminase n=1 Tax=Desulfatitalea alkaliphila TaxID=2929485 RepID=A0AA41R2S0_9BACT|nr:pyridoxal 5'-phosphate synthase glutaminase subunit PdxT [Desulfatitalea alkaliphila]MCJ8500631.1 pyridoxal 5'-phosphate synthase glutaminase subunit PdxT [Desulfatitalea alkaliphila]
MRVGLLGLQGAFLDHIAHLHRCGVTPCIVRDAQALSTVDRLIIPGGESTVMAKFLEAFGMRGPLRRRIDDGMPVWGVCAGAILLADQVDGHPGSLGGMPVAVQRNAYGRQIASDTHAIDVPLLALRAYPAIFIRAPRILSMGDAVAVHACMDNDPVFVQHGRLMATTFHPELHPGDAFHRYFIDL